MLCENNISGMNGVRNFRPKICVISGRGQVGPPAWRHACKPVVALYCGAEQRHAAINAPPSRRRLGSFMSQIKVAIVPVTPFQQNCTILICEATKMAAVVDPAATCR